METGTLNIVCSYCKKFIGTKPCSKENNGKISHGICYECLPKVEKDLEAVLAKLKGE